MSETRALAVIEQHQNAVSFVRHDDLLGIVPTFEAEVTIITPDPAKECHSISGKLMPKAPLTHQIAEACGIDFVELAKTLEQVPREDELGKRTVHVAYAQGRRRQKDGTYRKSSICHYEFDPVLRAEEDFTKDTKGTYKSDVARKKHILELRKFAAQRASTGARLRVIRELSNAPTTFERADIEKGLLFGKYIQNTEFILNDPEGRRMAIANAVGAEQSMYGPRERDVTPDRAQITAPVDISGAAEVEGAPDDDFESADGPVDEPEDETKESPAWASIIEYEESYNLPDSARAEIAKGREIGPQNIEEHLHEDLLRRIKAWADKHPEARR